MRALIDPDSGGKVLIYPPPVGYIPDPNLDPDGWGGRTELRFQFNPDRLLKCLEHMGVVRSHVASANDVKEQHRHCRVPLRFENGELRPALVA